MILSGRGGQILNGVGYPLSKGEIYMLTPADCHSIHVDEPLDIIGIMFDERMITPSVYEQILTHETMGANLTANFAGRSVTAAKALLDALIAGTHDTAVPDGNEYMYMCHIIDCLLDWASMPPGRMGGRRGSRRSARRYCTFTAIIWKT